MVCQVVPPEKTLSNPVIIEMKIVRYALLMKKILPLAVLPLAGFEGFDRNPRFLEKGWQNPNI